MTGLIKTKLGVKPGANDTYISHWILCIVRCLCFKLLGINKNSELVVSTHLKHIGQFGSFPQVSGWTWPNLWVATTQKLPFQASQHPVNCEELQPSPRKDQWPPPQHGVTHELTHHGPVGFFWTTLDVSKKTWRDVSLGEVGVVFFSCFKS